ncbi:hypothetical protein Cni_G03337 [Canna indica]|uniref:Pectinesterase inhibitor domain-containing protein n=1 Tax=Canna indica TaxID=4628 RepID=A0AAQ3JRF6_9LILI|nr:hypothetical protein Cni_G03337 [Canna indica]
MLSLASRLSKGNGSEAGSSNADGSLQTLSKAIQAIFQPTDYKEECESSLSKHVGNVTDPKKLLELTFNFAIDKLRDGFNHSVVLQEAAKDNRTSEALENYKELLDYVIGETRSTSFAIWKWPRWMTLSTTSRSGSAPPSPTKKLASTGSKTHPVMRRRP